MNLEAFASRFFFYVFMVGIGIRSVLSVLTSTQKSALVFSLFEITEVGIVLFSSSLPIRNTQKAATRVAAFVWYSFAPSVRADAHYRTAYVRSLSIFLLFRFNRHGFQLIFTVYSDFTNILYPSNCRS